MRCCDPVADSGSSQNSDRRGRSPAREIVPFAFGPGDASCLGRRLSRVRPGTSAAASQSSFPAPALSAIIVSSRFRGMPPAYTASRLETHPKDADGRTQKWAHRARPRRSMSGVGCERLGRRINTTDFAGILSAWRPGSVPAAAEAGARFSGIVSKKRDPPRERVLFVLRKECSSGQRSRRAETAAGC